VEWESKMDSQMMKPQLKLATRENKPTKSSRVLTNKATAKMLHQDTQN
jgi:hypothetical protein